MRGWECCVETSNHHLRREILQHVGTCGPKMVNHFMFLLFIECVCKTEGISGAMFSNLRDESIFNYYRLNRHNVLIRVMIINVGYVR